MPEDKNTKDSKFTRVMVYVLLITAMMPILAFEIGLGIRAFRWGAGI